MTEKRGWITMVRTCHNGKYKEFRHYRPH
jgi:hypothetical protein